MRQIKVGHDQDQSQGQAGPQGQALVGARSDRVTQDRRIHDQDGLGEV